MLPDRGPKRSPLFPGRREAGRALAAALQPYAGSDPAVLGIPRGGVPVAAEVARVLRADLDVLVARKVGAPGNEEFGVGAVAEAGVVVRDDALLEAFGVSAAAFEEGVARAQAEVSRRAARYRGDRGPLSLAGRLAIIVDDGIATGVTARAACRAARALGARAVVLAAPVAAADTARDLSREADRVVVLATPHPFEAVGLWYTDFGQTSDAEVEELVRRAHPAGAGALAPPVKIHALHIPVDDVHLAGELSVPPGPRALVVFAHGTGSGRKSPRNQKVAAELNRHGFATLLFDLLTAREEADETMTGELRFDVPFLAARLQAVTAWVLGHSAVRGLPIAYFGASTGAAAALTASAAGPVPVEAVVSRGGRPDLSAIALEAVLVPTLLIVGGDDRGVLALNRRALERLSGPRRLHVIPGAGHLFEEPGALDEVARAACEWFENHLVAKPAEHRASPLWGSVAS